MLIGSTVTECDFYAYATVFVKGVKISLSTLKPQGRNPLTLKKQVEVIKAAESDPKLSVRKLAESYDCGKTQISSILKEKQSILELCEANVAS